ncbi:MAG TPA: hypothetical protein VGO07_02300 [Candidatus Saccharimonadales bacterium]|jgi:hypothetical protein|nr:hypothetical protein [Candidatus Saccharimonadales bacterium]
MAKTSPPTNAKKKTAPAPKVPKTAPVTAHVVAPPANRRVKVPTYKSFKLQKKVTRELPKQLPSAFKIFRGALTILKKNWKLFLGIALVYAMLNMALVSGFSAVNLTDAKQSFSQAISGQISQLATGLSLFVYLLGNSGATTTPTASVYQIVLGIIISLAVLWALRQVYANNKPRVRDAFYRGMYPLVPFILVLLIIGLEIVPLAVGAFLYSTVVNNGIAATAVEQAMWLLLFLVFAIATVYMLCSTLFALYIVTLPDTTPIAALQSARQLVLHRRWTVVRKLLFLPLALIVLTAVIVTPLIIFAAPIAPWVFFGLSTLLLPVVHAYLYSLYRSML